MAWKAFPLLAAFGLLMTSLALVPAAEAQRTICPSPITVGGLVQCAADVTVAVLRSAEATAVCILGVPPSTYPSGLNACVTITILLEPTLP